MVAISGTELGEAELSKVKSLISNEVNIKDISYITEDNPILVKKAKPNFRALGPKAGKAIKEIAAALGQWGQDDIRSYEQAGTAQLELSGGTFVLESTDVEVLSEDIPGWLVATDSPFTVALDITINEELRLEGIAREFVNRIQNLRKSKGLEVTDNISLSIQSNPEWNEALQVHRDYISRETLSASLEVVAQACEDELEINGVTGSMELQVV